MAKARPKKSLADYVAIAIAPALIMLIVGTFVWFLAMLLYAGEFPERLNWVLGWFVFGSVLVARIGIEQGKEHAMIYGGLLGLATAIAVFQFIDRMPILAILLLGVIWWCTQKLTWDSTLIDEEQDASGQGLLQAGKLSGEAETTAPANQAANGDQAEIPKPPGWLAALRKKQNPDEPHAPGVWAVWFSLIVLVIFGVGQSLIPAEQSSERGIAFRLLFVFVIAAIGLLLTTSFLGLRRYLRQRRITMPKPMVAAWMGTGSTIAIVLVIACVLLPRPQAAYSVTSMLDRVDGDDKAASDHAVKGGEAGKGDGNRKGKDPDAKTDQKTSKKDGGEGQPGDGHGDSTKGKKTEQKDQGGSGKQKSDAKGDGKGNEKSGSKKGKGGSGSQKGNQKSDGKQEKEKQQQGENKPMNQAMSFIAKLFRWIIYAVLIVVAIWFLRRHGAALWAAFLSILADLRAFLARLFGRAPREREQVTTATGPTLSAARPFAAFGNPFRTSAATSPAELVRYTYDAVCAWGTEQQVPFSPDQTPMEYMQLLTAEIFMQDADGELCKSLSQLGKWYAALAYAHKQPPNSCVERIEQLWRRLESF